MKGKKLLPRLGRKADPRQIVITAEKSETFIIRQLPNGPVRSWCSQCREEIECLTVDQTTMLTGLSARKIFRLVESEGIHFCEMEAGQLFICPNSALDLFRLAGPTARNMSNESPTRNDCRGSHLRGEQKK